VNRGVGIAAIVWASLIGLSTVYTKQHYVSDVVAGIFLAYVAYVIFLRSYPREAVPELDRCVAPVLALGFIAVHGFLIGCFWFAYLVIGA
jgi:membrane-associated phospholipid phosphatase